MCLVFGGYKFFSTGSGIIECVLEGGGGFELLGGGLGGSIVDFGVGFFCGLFRSSWIWVWGLVGVGFGLGRVVGYFG